VLIPLFCRSGKSLNEVREEIKEAERLRLKKWSEGWEKRSREDEGTAASTKETFPKTSSSHPTLTQRKTSRKDNSPVKVTKSRTHSNLF
jgi:hypothetical protein